MILAGGIMGWCLLAGSAGAMTIKHAGEPPATTPAGAFNKVCSGCHSTELPRKKLNMDMDAWQQTAQHMVDNGAVGTPEEFDLVMQYLFENLTMVDVNHSDADTLGAVLPAPAGTVAAIIARREHQPFKNLGDLETIPGLNAAALDAKKRLIIFN
jgi:hypothetical protein